MRLIGKWLHTGVIDLGEIIYPEMGTQQGGVLSPLLANVYLHEVLDVWFDEEVKPRLKGKAFLVRYADDFVIGFEYEEDARKVYEVLPKRFAKYGLSIHPDKTKLRKFACPKGNDHDSETFDFLGFTHYWGKSRKGYWVIKKKTSRKRLRRAIKAVGQWCKENRHRDVVAQHQKLCQKLSGHYQYYAVTFNIKAIKAIYREVIKRWKYWMSRRSNDSYLNWEKWERFLTRFPLPQPRIIHSVMKAAT